MSSPAPPTAAPASPWWRDAVIYQVYPRSWADADGDGVGDLPGITSRLEHLVDLGVDAVWLSPFYASPQHDAGYDVSDFRAVDPLFGSLEDADAMIARAHDLGLRVVVDVVPNHTSSEHEWFRAAIADGLGSAAAARYVVRPGRGPDGEEPPNNWLSNFGGRAWSPWPGETNGELHRHWYLHLFDATQPDLDWTNPEVHDELDDVLRFWLDRGVDGFRIDVAHGMVKAEGLPDADLSIDPNVDPTGDLPMWDQPGVHDVFRRWRRLVDEYGPSDSRWADDGDRILCAEAWVEPAESLARYVRPDELHQSFNFAFLLSPWIAPELRAVIARTLRTAEDVGAPQTWVLSNHDVVRHASRLGYPQLRGRAPVTGVGPGDPQPDAVLGLRRARAATTLMLALPGSAYLYQGEELGLPEATLIPDDVRQDPTWERSGHTRRGRDGCRVPVPWTDSGPSLGFGPAGAPWLPQPPEYADLAPTRQRGRPDSTLELYRTLLRLRRELGLGRRRLEWIDHDSPDVLALRLSADGADSAVDAASEEVVVLANTGPDEVPLPPDVRVLVSSATIEAGTLPPDTAAWVRRS